MDLLDGVAIGVSLLTGDFETAGSVMFLLKLGDHLEEWTLKKSVDVLAQHMALNVDSAWLRTEGGAEAREAVKLLHQAGFPRIMMLTGDSERTAAAIAREAGVDG